MDTKKYSQIPELNNIKTLDKYDFARLFNVVQLGEKSYFNINKTINFTNVRRLSIVNLYDVSN